MRAPRGADPTGARRRQRSADGDFDTVTTSRSVGLTLRGAAARRVEHRRRVTTAPEGRAFGISEGGNTCGMILVGIVLLILGFIFAIHILWILGIIAVVLGAILWFLGATGRAVGGRSHYF
jgi:hypothetical protein